MKTKLGSALAILLAFRLHAQEAKITVHVVDESGVAVSNAQASAGFDNALKPGEGWGTGIPTEVSGITDAKGICVLEGKDTAGSVGTAVLKDGYYGSDGYGIVFTNYDSILRRWEPWNPMVEVVLQKKGVQVPMYARKIYENKIPVEGKPVGFDLMVGDWVAPYGNGQTTDFIFQLDVAPMRWITNWYGMTPRPFALENRKLVISFPNDGDGIQPAISSGHGLRLPRLAPADGYESILAKHRYDEITGIDNRTTKVRHNTDFQKDANYFFRVRSKKNAQGNIVSSLYGKIYGELNLGSGSGVSVGSKLTFTYYLNPEPNSRNMEFDPKQNLFKNLPLLERVSAP